VNTSTEAELLEVTARIKAQAMDALGADGVSPDARAIGLTVLAASSMLVATIAKSSDNITAAIKEGKL